jgi:membrane protease YdiL (CAAX protease family)
MAGRREAGEIMSLDDRDPFAPKEIPAEGDNQNDAKASNPANGESSQPWLDELQEQAAAIESSPQRPPKLYPPDLEISWSWAHFIVFGVFGFISLAAIQGVMATIYMPHRRMTAKQLEEYLISKPQFAIGSMLIWYAVIFFFLYVTLSLLRGHSFWETLGWRKLVPLQKEMPKNPLVYFLAGCGLSFIVAFLTSGMKAPENTPIEELFKFRMTALLFVAMAVLVAPLVEETLFRGYLYPMFARSFGITPAILLTGLLFGVMHGAQLGWTWGLVATLTLVGVVFTLVRARTGTVVASFLMHLGYNSLISVIAIVTTHGFTKVPTGK